jgi:cell division protein FtsL
VAFALIGIVTMQLGLLKLNSGIGRALEHQALLQRENAALSIEDSELGAGARVQSRAARLGMELAPLRGLVFLAVRPGVDPTRAATALATFGQPAAGTSEAAGATAATASSESGSAPSASSESSAGSARAGSPSETSAAGAPAATSRPSEATSSSSPEASARPAPGASTPSGAEVPGASGAPGAGGGETASGGGTSASASGG